MRTAHTTSSQRSEYGTSEHTAKVVEGCVRMTAEPRQRSAAVPSSSAPTHVAAEVGGNSSEAHLRRISARLRGRREASNLRSPINVRQVGNVPAY